MVIFDYVRDIGKNTNMSETWVLPPKSTQSGGCGDDRGMVIVPAESVQVADTAERLGGEVREGGDVFGCGF